MKRLRQLTVGLALCALALPAMVGAQAVTQSYSADTALQPGLIVRLADNDKDKVVPVSADKADKATGVVVRPTEAPISLTGDLTKQQVYVATNGTYRVLVSDQNGPIVKDDYIAISSLSGVGMKADGGQNVILGKAATPFDGRRNTAGTTKVTDTNGSERAIQLGYVEINISIARNPLQRSTRADLPGFLQKASETVAGKSVSTVRVYFSLAVLLVTAVIVGALLYGAVRASMISLGRNPMAKAAITRSLLKVVLVSLIVLSSGLGAVYLLLRL